MKINQTKNQVFTKGLDEVESNVLGVVKRFFDRNPEELNGSIEGITLEVLKRVKSDLLESNLLISVVSVNNKTGEVILEASDIGAEPAISKNTAFNKDFGDKPDTICAGDDPRLSDKREPKEHEHTDYIHVSDIDRYIEESLKKRGIVFAGEGGIQISKDIILTDDAEIIEV